jgi:hypothetical protein
MRKEAGEKQSDEALAFTDLTRRLLAVPKREVDAKKAEYEKQKERKNEKRAK